MKEQLKTRSFLPALCFALCLFSPANAAESESAFLKGKVLDQEGHPVGGARIVLHNEDTREESSGRSNGKGEFEVEHQKCSTISFDVFPGKKSGLSSAHYAHVSGELSKHMIVQLHKGFKVTGRILSEGQGVKGLEVRAIGQEDGKGGATVHGGGHAKTRADGEYEFWLTPGKKIVQIKNGIYSNLAPVYQHEFTISGDTRLPDMTLPLLKE